MSKGIADAVKVPVKTKGPHETERAVGNGLLIGVVSAVALLTLIRFALAGVTELLPEEAYYWMYSKHPSLGYFDHPPMVAWVIAAGTTLFGDTQLGVRFVTFLLWIASCVLLFLTGRLWFGRRTALVATLLFVLTPVCIGIGLIVTPDAPLLFFWLATLYFVSQALHTNRGAYWLFAGVAFGGAMLSKYYALLLAPSVVLFLLLSPTHRHWLRRPQLRRPQLWLALPIALLVFSPVIVWNAQHEWVSFLFQSTRTAAPQTHRMRDALRFWIVQMGMLGPLLFVLFACAATRSIKRGWLQRDDRWNFVASFSLPLFFLFMAASFRMEVHVNWTAPAFLSLAIGAGVLALEGLDSADAVRAKRWRLGAGATVAISAAVVVLGLTNLAWGIPRSLAYSHAGGWRALAEDVKDAQNELMRQTSQQPFVIGMDKYNIAAELGFYLRQPQECVNKYALGEHGLGFRYWTDLRKFEGRPAIVVLSNPRKNLPEELRRHFDRLDEPVSLSLHSHGTRQRNVYLVYGYSYHVKEKPPADRQP